MSFLKIARRWMAPATEDVTFLAALEELEREGTATKLRMIAEGLTPEEHERLRAEAAMGDRLAKLLTAVLDMPTVVRCLACGGDRWRPDPSGIAERCAACGAWSPISMIVTEDP